MHFFKWVLALCLVTFTFKSEAKDAAIFDSRKPVALSKNETTYIDFYINAGTEEGIQRGVLITAVRSASLYDAYQNKSPGDLVIPVGQLKIIHVQKGLSVGRIHKIFTRENLPTLDYNYIMVGDRLDLSTMVAESKAKKTSASEVSAPSDKKIEKKAVEMPKETVDFASSLPENTSIDLPQLQ